MAFSKLLHIVPAGVFDKVTLKNHRVLGGGKRGTAKRKKSMLSQRMRGKGCCEQKKGIENQ